MTPNGIRPIHPGEILRDEYLEPLRIGAHALAIAKVLEPEITPHASVPGCQRLSLAA